MVVLNQHDAGMLFCSDRGTGGFQRGGEILLMMIVGINIALLAVLVVLVAVLTVFFSLVYGGRVVSARWGVEVAMRDDRD